MLEEYVNVLLIEVRALSLRRASLADIRHNSRTVRPQAETMVSMANTDFIPALAADLKGYEGTPLAGGRPAAYGAVATAAEALSKARATPRRFLAAARSLSARARARGRPRGGS